jgi:hypothetical protein
MPVITQQSYYKDEQERLVEVVDLTETSVTVQYHPGGATEKLALIDAERRIQLGRWRWFAQLD